MSGAGSRGAWGADGVGGVPTANGTAGAP
jgi:hypothetical protein